MILKIKALLYRLTGIHLANKEEQKHLDLPAIKQTIERYQVSYGFNEETAKGLVIGLWQCDNGFYRTWKADKWK